MANDLKLQVILNAVDKITRPLKSIQAAAGSAARDVSETQKHIKELNKAAGQIDGYRKVSRSLGITSTELGKAQTEAQRLAKELAATANPTKGMIRNFEQARSQVQRLERRQAELTQTQRNNRAMLKDAGIDTRSLATHQRDLTRQLGEANRALERQKDQLKAVGEQQKRLAAARAKYDKSLEARGALAGRGTAAVAAGAGGLALFAGQAITGSSQGAKAAAQLGQREAAGQYNNIITNVYGAGAGESMEAAGQAVQITASAFGGLDKRNEQQITQDTKDALAIARTFDLDMREVIETANIMVTNQLAKTSTEALDLITAGMQNVSAAMRNELPEILHEYSTFFRGMGFSGEEAMNLLAAQAEQGKFALDKTGDAIKEFSIRGSDDSKTSAEAYEAIGLNAGQMFSAVASGGDAARQALQQTARGLLNITDPATRANAAIALFGTPIEDLAVDQIPQFLQALGQLPDELGEVSGATARMSDTLTHNAGDALRRIGRLISGEMMGVLKSFEQDIIGISKAITGWAKEHPELVDSLARAAVAVGLLAIAGGSLALIIAGLIGPFAAVKWAATVLGITTMPGLTQSLKDAGTGALGLLGRVKALSGQTIQYRQAARRAAAGTKAWTLAQWASVKATLAAGAANTKLGFAAVTRGIVGATAALLGKVAAMNAYVAANGVMGTATSLAAAGAIKLVSAFKLVGNAILFVGRAALFNPVGLVITGLALAAVAIIKYWQPIKAFFVGFWQGLKEGFAPLGEAFSAAFGAWAGILAPLKPLWDGLAWAIGTVVGWVGKLLSPLQSTTEQLEGATSAGRRIGEVLAGLIGFFPNLIAGFIELGGNLVSGLIGGIVGKMGELKDAVSGMGASAIGWFKDKLGIRSPSRVFAQLGDDTMAGLAVGLARNHDPEKQVAGMADRLKAAGAALAIGTAALPAAAEFSPVPDAQRQIREQLQPAALADIPAERRRIIEQLQPAGLPPVPDATRTIRERVERANLPDTSAAVARIQTQQQKAAQNRPAPAAPSSAPTSVTYNVSFTIESAPGASAEDIGREVERRMEAFARRQQYQNEARQRARLVDLE